MHENARTTLEVMAPTVDEAVAQGLAQLGLSLDDVEVEILDRGGRGLFGLLGHRDARVRLVIKAPPQSASASASTPAPAPAAEAPAAPAEEAAPPAPKKRGRKSGHRRPRKRQQQRKARAPEAASQPSADEGDRALRIARETVAELLEKMGVEAEVEARYGEADRGRRRPIMVDVHGDDLSILIGRRAERLNALQFITRLIVGKELGHTATIIIDVENYRKRREQQLRRMAKRLADQAARTGRRVAMEPMPANERRIVHIALRDDPRVTTESVGREPRRKVMIIPEA